MVIRELLVKLGLEFNEKGLHEAKEKLGDFKKALGTVASAFAGAALIHELRAVIDETTGAAVSLERMALSFGMSAAQLEALTFAAEQSGAGAEQLQVAFSRLAAGVEQAGSGSKEAMKEFREAGISIRDSQGQLRPVNELFLELSDRFKDMKNPTEKAALAVRLFGRGGAQLIPLLSRGSEGIGAFGDDLEHLGAAMDEDFIASSKAYRAEVGRENKALEGLKIAITKAVLPAFKAVAYATAEFVGFINRALKNTEYLRVGFVVLGAIALGLAIKMIAPFVPYILIAAAVVAGTLAVIAVIEDLWMLFTGGESLIGKLIDKWWELVTSFASGGSPEDNWFVQFLRTAAQGVLYLRELWNTWDIQLREFANSISISDSPFLTFLKMAADGVLKIKDAFDNVGQALDNSTLWQLFKAANPINAFSAMANPVGAVKDFARMAMPDGDRNSLLSGAVADVITPSRQIGAPGRSGASVMQSNNSQISVTVNGAGDPQATAVEVRRQLDEYSEGQAQEAYSALVPVVAQ